MPNSLRSKLSSLRYKGKITEEEYKDLIRKLDGHDKALRTPWIPCSEQLPEEEVLCCDIQNNIMLGYVFVDMNSESGFSAENENCFMYECVAWMPKPEGYKGGENNGK